MATKEIINFHSHYEDLDDTAWPATRTHNDKAVEAKIRDFQRRQNQKLGAAALKSFGLGRPAL